MTTICRSCGLRDGAHEADCRSILAEARAQLQAACDHRREYGATQTTGDPLGPPCCGRCGKELEPTRVLHDTTEVDAPPRRRREVSHADE